ncbi:large ribosomal subunit protein mL52 [Stomoxys calcitrans]|uniref:large ribosomal subunit protein mL52 n=1 Tax=Stomoxys calcitrans TaxID=35570 RepID=UPI0027E35E1B|nr:large ribosomal subunit protein mL52 [Stomoxys calcitrans]
MIRITNNAGKLMNIGFTRSVSCTTKLSIDQRWREEKGLPANPNAYGPLSNLPDYTYLDGRATPMGSNQRKRIVKQQEIAAKIVTLNKELDMAKQRFQHLKQKEQEDRQKVMQAKLKPKGKLLLTKQAK